LSPSPIAREKSRKFEKTRKEINSMKACPKCQTKNQDSSQFCKQCGRKLSVSAFEDKKEKVMGEKKTRVSGKVVSLAAVALVLLAGIVYWVIQKGDAVAESKISSQPRIADRVDYTGQAIRMFDISAKVENGKVSIPLDAVREKKMVRFEYKGNGATIPIVSYITPSGKIITAVSMCEPCRSTRFHIQDKSIVCNACNTEWNLETLKGIQGGCLNYPPDVLPSTIAGGQIQIDEKVVARWKPRV
jgi:uncharacterized protein